MKQRILILTMGFGILKKSKFLKAFYQRIE